MVGVYIMLALAALGVIVATVCVGLAVNRRQRREWLENTVQMINEQHDRELSPDVRALVNLYMTIVAKHGPDSEEAKAFRFGTDNPQLKQLHGADSLAEFNMQADLIDETCRRLRKKRRDARRLEQLNVK